MKTPTWHHAIFSMYILLVFIFIINGCAYITHEIKEFPGEVFLTPPPENFTKDKIIHFRVTDSYIRLLEMLPLYSYSLDKSLKAANPFNYPIYTLKLGETFEWWEWLLVIADLASDFGGPDSRSVELNGIITVPESDKSWQPKKQSPIFGPSVKYKY